jgi:hypothetical protein
MSGHDSEREPKGKAAEHGSHAAHRWSGRSEKPKSHSYSRELWGPSAPSSGFLLFPLQLPVEAVNAHPLCIGHWLGSLELGEEPKNLGSTEMRAQTEAWSCLPDPGANLF